MTAESTTLPAKTRPGTVPVRWTEGMRAVPVASGDSRKTILAGWLVVLAAFGGLGGWAATAPLAAAVVAPGTIVVESNRKSVQHLEGGIVEEILVREGDTVRRGDVLVRLEPTQAMASAAVVTNQFETHQALEARLIAERDGRDTIVFPEDLRVTASVNAEVRAILDAQRQQFEERRKSVEGQISILEKRVDQNREEIEGLEVQRTSKRRQLEIFKDELVGLRELFEQGHAPRTRILAMQREMARLEGEIGADTASIARAQQAIGEAELQMIQTHQQFREDVVGQLREVQTQLSELRERSTVATDILSRTDIRAPREGIVQNLMVHTIGGVVRPGETLMEIVPEEDRLIIEAQVSPRDVDNVSPGMETEVRFSAFTSRNLPIIDGSLVQVSPDRIVDEHNPNNVYYEARVEVSDEELAKLGTLKLRAGMPAEVMIKTGERTVLNYFLKPLEDAMFRGMTEE
ncbi:HlyD family type I secretion periplasmic adaptor subunit [Roseospira visakhapatnamensis]|uniref:Membrane fusion protein (MFP) family protein n=1 Tax=Roseospira visakhapatnamensis TaxID=390880 RepID=A0A7W6REH3_9PROT|nr:HlyD family type I secretion periplasmic adaptor subunit [Roseospira visakhapatnamensis]MBB4267069.1 HlyD family type I secretion membrane fusion protein [Roseospira visakhapatnamensis]